MATGTEKLPTHLLLTHLPIPDQVARHLYRDPARKPAILNNPACHTAIQALVEPDDQKQITETALYRGLHAGSEGTLALYLQTPTFELELTDAVLTKWTLSEKDQLTFAQHNLSSLQLQKGLYDRTLTSQARLIIAERLAGMGQPSTVVDYLETTADVHGNAEQAAHLVIMLRHHWLGELPKTLVPDVPEITDHMWGAYVADYRWRSRHGRHDVTPMWFDWTAAYCTAETAADIVGWILNPQADTDRQTWAVGTRDDITSATRVLLARPDLDRDLRARLWRHAAQTFNFENRAKGGWEHRILHVDWIPGEHQTPVDMAKSTDLPAIRTALQTLRNAANREAGGQTSGAGTWHLRCTLQAGLNPTVAADQQTAAEVLQSLTVHPQNHGDGRHRHPGQSYLYSTVLQHLQDRHRPDNLPVNLPVTPTITTRQPPTTLTPAPATSQYTPHKTDTDPDQDPDQDQNRDTDSTGHQTVSDTDERAFWMLVDATDMLVIGGHALSGWEQRLHFDCYQEQTHGCHKPFQQLGDTLRNAFGDNINKWQLFLGLVDACVDQNATFQQLIDTVHQITQ